MSIPFQYSKEPTVKNMSLTEVWEANDCIEEHQCYFHCGDTTYECSADPQEWSEEDLSALEGKSLYFFDDGHLLPKSFQSKDTIDTLKEHYEWKASYKEREKREGKIIYKLRKFLAMKIFPEAYYD